MKKNGFTLIELLAIIVILAIIAVITVPIILNIIDNAEKNSAIDSAYGYKDALQKYYTTKLVQNPEQELPSGYLEISELPSDFTVTGEKPIDGWVKLKKGKVERYSLKYKDYVVTIDNDKNIVSEKQDKVEPHVPNEYQEVEYLESTGTQYIDTEAKLFKNNNHEIDIEFIPTSFYNYVTIWGTNYDNDTFESWIYSTGKLAGRYNNVRYGTDTTLELEKKYSVKYLKKDNNLFMYINGDLNHSTVPTVNNKIVDSNLFLFKSGADYGSYKLSNAKLYSDNNLIRNLVPVIRKSDGKSGLLDLANYNKNLSSINEVKDATWATQRSDFVDVLNSLDTGTYTLSYVVTLTERKSVDDDSDYGVYFTNSSGAAVSNQGIKWNSLGAGSSLSTNYTFTITDTMKGNFEKAYFYGCGKHGTGPLGKADFTNIQIEKGTESTTYEPYGYKFYTNAGIGDFTAGPKI